ncbi:MAG: hypothetical protein LBC56_06325, partial [Oscillospiraceae bacterium]|nr:hypothetical protein [Oscillospiraceae bacterium]
MKKRMYKNLLMLTLIIAFIAASLSIKGLAEADDLPSDTGTGLGNTDLLNSEEDNQIIDVPQGGLADEPDSGGNGAGTPGDVSGDISSENEIPDVSGDLLEEAAAQATPDGASGPPDGVSDEGLDFLDLNVTVGSGGGGGRAPRGAPAMPSIDTNSPAYSIYTAWKIQPPNGGVPNNPNHGDNNIGVVAGYNPATCKTAYNEAFVYLGYKEGNSWTELTVAGDLEVSFTGSGSGWFSALTTLKTSSGNITLTDVKGTDLTKLKEITANSGGGGHYTIVGNSSDAASKAKSMWEASNYGETVTVTGPGNDNIDSKWAWSACGNVTLSGEFVNPLTVKTGADMSHEYGTYTTYNGTEIRTWVWAQGDPYPLNNYPYNNQYKGTIQWTSTFENYYSQFIVENGGLTVPSLTVDTPREVDLLGNITLNGTGTPTLTLNDEATITSRSNQTISTTATSKTWNLNVVNPKELYGRGADRLNLYLNGNMNLSGHVKTNCNQFTGALSNDIVNTAGTDVVAPAITGGKSPTISGMTAITPSASWFTLYCGDYSDLKTWNVSNVELMLYHIQANVSGAISTNQNVIIRNSTSTTLPSINCANLDIVEDSEITGLSSNLNLSSGYIHINKSKFGGSITSISATGGVVISGNASNTGNTVTAVNSSGGDVKITDSKMDGLKSINSDSVPGKDVYLRGDYKALETIYTQQTNGVVQFLPTGAQPGQYGDTLAKKTDYPHYSVDNGGKTSTGYTTDTNKYTTTTAAVVTIKNASKIIANNAQVNNFNDSTSATGTEFKVEDGVIFEGGFYKNLRTITTKTANNTINFDSSKEKTTTPRPQNAQAVTFENDNGIQTNAAKVNALNDSLVRTNQIKYTESGSTFTVEGGKYKGYTSNANITIDTGTTATTLKLVSTGHTGDLCLAATTTVTGDKVATIDAKDAIIQDVSKLIVPGKDTQAPNGGTTLKDGTYVGVDAAMIIQSKELGGVINLNGSNGTRITLPTTTTITDTTIAETPITVNVSKDVAGVSTLQVDDKTVINGVTSASADFKDLLNLMVLDVSAPSKEEIDLTGDLGFTKKSITTNAAKIDANFSGTDANISKLETLTANGSVTGDFTLEGGKYTNESKTLTVNANFAKDNVTINEIDADELKNTVINAKVAETEVKFTNVTSSSTLTTINADKAKTVTVSKMKTSSQTMQVNGLGADNINFTDNKAYPEDSLQVKGNSKELTNASDVTFASATEGAKTANKLELLSNFKTITTDTNVSLTLVTAIDKGPNTLAVPSGQKYATVSELIFKANNPVLENIYFTTGTTTIDNGANKGNNIDLTKPHAVYISPATKDMTLNGKASVAVGTTVDFESDFAAVDGLWPSTQNADTRDNPNYKGAVLRKITFGETIGGGDATRTLVSELDLSNMSIIGIPQIVNWNTVPSGSSEKILKLSQNPLNGTYAGGSDTPNVAELVISVPDLTKLYLDDVGMSGSVGNEQKTAKMDYATGAVNNDIRYGLQLKFDTTTEKQQYISLISVTDTKLGTPINSKSHDKNGGNSIDIPKGPNLAGDKVDYKKADDWTYQHLIKDINLADGISSDALLTIDHTNNNLQALNISKNPSTPIKITSNTNYIDLLIADSNNYTGTWGSLDHLSIGANSSKINYMYIDNGNADTINFPGGEINVKSNVANQSYHVTRRLDLVSNSSGAVSSVMKLVANDFFNTLQFCANGSMSDYKTLQITGTDDIAHINISNNAAAPTSPDEISTVDLSNLSLIMIPQIYGYDGYDVDHKALILTGNRLEELGKFQTTADWKTNDLAARGYKDLEILALGGQGEVQKLTDSVQIGYGPASIGPTTQWPARNSTRSNLDSTWACFPTGTTPAAKPRLTELNLSGMPSLTTLDFSYNGSRDDRIDLKTINLYGLAALHYGKAVAPAAGVGIKPNTETEASSTNLKYPSFFYVFSISPDVPLDGGVKISGELAKVNYGGCKQLQEGKEATGTGSKVGVLQLQNNKIDTIYLDDIDNDDLNNIGNGLVSVNLRNNMLTSADNTTGGSGVSATGLHLGETTFFVGPASEDGTWLTGDAPTTTNVSILDLSQNRLDEVILPVKNIQVLDISENGLGNKFTGGPTKITFNDGIKLNGNTELLVLNIYKDEIKGALNLTGCVELKSITGTPNANTYYYNPLPTSYPFKTDSATDYIAKYPYFDAAVEGVLNLTGCIDLPLTLDFNNFVGEAGEGTNKIPYNLPHKLESVDLTGTRFTDIQINNNKQLENVILSNRAKGAENIQNIELINDDILEVVPYSPGSS